MEISLKIHPDGVAISIKKGLPFISPIAGESHDKVEKKLSKRLYLIKQVQR